MNDITFEDSGMEEFQDMLGSYLSKVDEKSALDAIEEGAKEFVNDLLRLPKPRRKVTAPGYTHLVDSFSYKRDKTGIDVGWGKYYGPMLEQGTKKMSAKAHLKPLFFLSFGSTFPNILLPNLSSVTLVLLVYQRIIADAPKLIMP